MSKMSRKGKKVLKFYIFLAIVALLVIFVPKIYREVRMKIVSSAVDKAMASSNFVITDSNGNQVTFSQVVEKLDDEDEEKVNDLLDKYVTISSIQEVNDMMNNDNVSTEDMQQYLNENVEQQDIDYIMSLYEKYGDSF